MSELHAEEVTLGVRIRTDKGIEYVSGSQFYLDPHQKGVTSVSINK
jgi:hypothetical protein